MMLLQLLIADFFVHRDKRGGGGELYMSMYMNTCRGEFSRPFFLYNIVLGRYTFATFVLYCCVLGEICFISLTLSLCIYSTRTL
jgi:hypothetical protein